jgi:hypothetical protein
VTEVDHRWRVLVDEKRHLLDRALAFAGGTHTVEDILAGLDEERYQAWPGVHSILVTEIIQTPRRKIAHCFLAAGLLEEIDAMRPMLEGWAKRQGCEAVTIAGRRGWERALKDAGYGHDSTVLRKEL